MTLLCSCKGYHRSRNEPFQWSCFVLHSFHVGLLGKSSWASSTAWRLGKCASPIWTPAALWETSFRLFRITYFGCLTTCNFCRHVSDNAWNETAPKCIQTWSIVIDSPTLLTSTTLVCARSPCIHPFCFFFQFLPFFLDAKFENIWLKNMLKFRKSK